jgi:hypothetical protein
MLRALAALALVFSLALVACSRDASEEKVSISRGPAGTGSAVATPAPAPAIPSIAAPSAPPKGIAPESGLVSQDSAAGSGGTLGQLDTVQRQIISTASISLEVNSVEQSITRARSIAENLGGFVENLSASGGKERQVGYVTVRVPQPQFFTALEQLRALGTVQSQNVGSQDVTEQFIDLKARLESAKREEQSLLSLLSKAVSVSDVLTIERELARVRSEIERLQGQLNFLERRVDLATINVNLSEPSVDISNPPSGFLEIQVADVTATVERTKVLVASVKGTIESVSITERDGVQRAQMQFRVFAKNFPQTVATLEGYGKVIAKEINEGVKPAEGDLQESKRPDAPVTLMLEEKPGFPRAAIVGIVIGAVVVGGGLVALVLGVMGARKRRTVG